MSSYENTQRKNKEALKAAFRGKPVIISKPVIVNKPQIERSSNKPLSYENVNRKEKDALLKSFKGNYVPLKSNNSRRPNSTSSSNSRLSIDELKKQSRLMNQPIVDQIKFNLGKCKDVTKNFNRLNDEFNYTIRIVNNMVTLIETNGQFLQQIKEALNEDWLSDTEIINMRNQHVKLVNDFKVVYNGLLERNKDFIDQDTLNKLYENIANFERVTTPI